MNCLEIKDRTSLFLADELDPRERTAFAAHLRACPACKQAIETLQQLDARLRETLQVELPDSSRVEHAVRVRIAAGRSKRRWLAAAGIAAGIVAAAGSSRLWSPRPESPMYADAARDHQAEVVNRQPRRWRSDMDEIQALTRQNGLTFDQAAALAPAGYALERAKNCGLAGERMLHLIFGNGSREYSVYLRPHRAASQPVRLVQQDQEQVAGLETGRFQALVVTSGPEQDCTSLAGTVKERL